MHSLRRAARQKSKHTDVGLLVSVRDEDEAEVAIRGGADWIDVKEPALGALGRADWDVIDRVVQRVASRRPVSAALGELDEIIGDLDCAARCVEGLALVKVGLARTRRNSQWRSNWIAVANTLSSTTALAAVVYADWESAGAPSPYEVVELAIGVCDAILIDTFLKKRKTTLQALSGATIQEIFNRARESGMLTVLAGGLTMRDIPAAYNANPDYIGIRGAACTGTRASHIDATKILRFKSAIAEHGS